jgi:signal transduction histidine kinase
MKQAESFSQTDIHPVPSASLLVGGEMGERIRNFEWSTTPLGPVEQWPQGLLTLVATSLRSRFPIVIWWDRHHYTMLYNDAYTPFLGKTKHPGCLGRSGRDCWREIWSIIGPMLEGVFETGQPTWSEDLLLVMDRNLPHEETYFTFSYSAIPGADGAVDGIFCACTETTERVIGERRLRTLRDLTSRASEGRSAEEACEIAARLLGSNDADIPFALIYLLGQDRTVAHLVAHSGLGAGSQAAPATIALSSSTQGGVWPLFEVAHQGKPALLTPLSAEFGALSGGPWPESPNAALVLPLNAPEHNQVTGFLVVGVNPRRELDESYRDFFDLVAGHVATAVANARAYEEERKRAEALAELDQAKTLFFSNISHEFRTPLTLMLGPIEDLLASGSELSLAQREALELLRRNALRLLRLVNTLLDFSRLEAGRMEAVYEPVDLAALTTDLASSFRSAIEKAGMALLVECPPDLPLVYVDQQMWEKIMLNLLSNAFKYTFQGAITVRIEPKEQAVEVSVQDTGVGIPTSELPHMFERFHRVKGTSGRTYEGTGIGLSLVYELVKLHAGTIRVSSTPGQGSTFTASLPLGSSHLPAERLAARRTLPSTTVSTSIYVEEALQLLAGQEAVSNLLPDLSFTASPGLPSSPADTGEQQPGARILFADDNADMRQYVSRLFHPRYSVQVVPDGNAALRAVKQSPPDLVLADVMMPGMDGFALLHALRSDPQTRHIPVILLSARAGEEAQIEGMTKGADDYLIKPFSARELLARVGAHLEMACLRKEAQERIKAERQRLYDLFMQAPALILVLRGPDHVFELANPPALQLLGLHQPIIGKSVREVLPELEVVLPELKGQSLIARLDAVYQTGQPCVGTNVLVHLDRTGDGTLEKLYFNFVYQPSSNALGDIDGIMIYANEITEQVKARQQSEDLSRQKDDFIGVASHELKTPVTSLKGFAQLLERRFRRDGDARAADLLHKMDAQLTKLTNLVNDLLDVTKIENGQLQLRCSLFDYNTLITEVIEEIQRAAPRHRIVSELRASVTLFADRDRIGQILTNLLTNAIKYSPQADTVLVKTICTDGTVVTSVQDFGIGIATEKLPHLFERFYRVEGDNQATYPGLGLGLYIAAAFITRHHGEIWIQSTEGQGTTISFSLPRQHTPEEHRD